MTALDLAALLERGARDPLQRAALALLLGIVGVYDRIDVADRWYKIHPEFGPHAPFGEVLWHRVAADADRGLVPLSPGERAVLLLAASLAVGHRVDLAELLPLLDDQHAAGLVVGIHSLLRPRDPITSEWDAVRFAGQGDRS